MANRKFVLNPIAPAQAAITTESSQIVAFNVYRTSIVIINTSDNPVYLSFGIYPAVVGCGIVVFPSGGTFLMDDNTAAFECINAISTGVASVAIQEFN